MLLPQNNWVKTLERQEILRNKLLEKGYNVTDNDFFLSISDIENLSVSKEDRCMLLSELKESIIETGGRLWDVINNPIIPHTLIKKEDIRNRFTKWEKTLLRTDKLDKVSKERLIITKLHPGAKIFIELFLPDGNYISEDTPEINWDLIEKKLEYYSKYPEEQKIYGKMLFFY